MQADTQLLHVDVDIRVLCQVEIYSGYQHSPFVLLKRQSTLVSAVAWRGVH